MASDFKEDVFLILFFVVVCVSALTLIVTLMRLAKAPPGRKRNLTMAGLTVGFLVGTPVVLYVLMLIKYLFFDDWR